MEEIEFDQEKYVFHPKIEILRELRDKPFPEVVKISATSKFQDFYSDKTHRGQKRLSLILGCVYDSFREFNEIKDIYDLAKQLGLSEKLVGSAIKNFRISQSTKNSLSNTTTRYLGPLDIVPGILEKMGYLGNCPDLKLVYERIQGKSDILHRSKPQSVAHALVYYYLTTSGQSVDIEKFCQGNGPCVMTVKKIVDEISLLES